MINAEDYFAKIKDMKQKSSDAFLNSFYNIVEHELSKAVIAKQDIMIRRLAYCLDVVEKERKLLKKGIDTFILREDIETFITKVADKAVKVTELSTYPRSIPDEFISVIKELREENLFDNYYVVYTDYTHETTKEIEKVKRVKDPILFGTYEQLIGGVWDIHDRFYYIGDWEDEYCDLTLSKMCDAMSKKGFDISKKVSIPELNREEVNKYLNSLIETEQDNRFNIGKGKKSIATRVKLAFKALFND